MSTQSSELGDDRPLVACAFRPDGGQLAVGSWTGLVKLWATPACSLDATHRCHDDRITGTNSALDAIAVICRFCQLCGSCEG